MSRWVQMQKHLRFQDLFQLHSERPADLFRSLYVARIMEALNVFHINYVFRTRQSFFVPFCVEWFALFTRFNQMEEHEVLLLLLLIMMMLVPS